MAFPDDHHLPKQAKENFLVGFFKGIWGFLLRFLQAVSQGGWNLALAPCSYFCMHLVSGVCLGLLERKTHEFLIKS